MYLRFPVIADICAYVLNLSKTELARELGIAIPTLNAYRTHTRYPRDAEGSSIRQTTADLLQKASDELNIPLYNANNYIMSCMSLNEKLNLWARDSHFQFQMSALAADVVYHYFTDYYEYFNTPGKNDDNITPKQLLTFLLTHNVEMLPQIMLWLIKEYIKSIELYLVSSRYTRDYFWTHNWLFTEIDTDMNVSTLYPPLLIKHQNTISYYKKKYELYENLKDEEKDEYGKPQIDNKWLGIAFPYNLDILMLTMKLIDFSFISLSPPKITEHTPKYEGSKVYPAIKFSYISPHNGESITYIGHKTISY